MRSNSDLLHTIQLTVNQSNTSTHCVSATDCCLWQDLLMKLSDPSMKVNCLLDNIVVGKFFVPRQLDLNEKCLAPITQLSR